MKITAIETIRLSRGITVHAGPIQWLWVRVHTDSGLTGLGETYPQPAAESLQAFWQRVAGIDIERCPLCQVGKLHTIQLLAPRSQAPP